MNASRRSFLKKSVATAAALSVSPRIAVTQPSTIRIGVIYDLTGPFAAGGSIACSIGAQIAIDLVNDDEVRRAFLMGSSGSLSARQSSPCGCKAS